MGNWRGGGGVGGEVRYDTAPLGDRNRCEPRGDEILLKLQTFMSFIIFSTTDTHLRYCKDPCKTNTDPGSPLTTVCIREAGFRIRIDSMRIPIQHFSTSGSGTRSLV